MQQSTHIQPDLESVDCDIEATGPNIIDLSAHLVAHDDRGLTLYYVCPFCNREHDVRLDWENAHGWVEITRHCNSKHKLQNTIIRVRPPQGYLDHWHNGYANPGTVYPEPAPIDDRKDYVPREHGPCPTGCIKDHHRYDLTEEHYSITRTNLLEAANQETPRMMVRTQQFMINTDPSDLQSWINVQLHDLDHRTHQEFDLSKDQAKQLTVYLIQLWRGLGALEAVTPAGKGSSK